MLEAHAPKSGIIIEYGKGEVEELGSEYAESMCRLSSAASTGAMMYLPLCTMYDERSMTGGETMKEPGEDLVSLVTLLGDILLSSPNRGLVALQGAAPALAHDIAPAHQHTLLTFKPSIVSENNHHHHHTPARRDLLTASCQPAKLRINQTRCSVRLCHPVFRAS